VKVARLAIGSPRRRLTEAENQLHDWGFEAEEAISGLNGVELPRGSGGY